MLAVTAALLATLLPAPAVLGVGTYSISGTVTGPGDVPLGNIDVYAWGGAGATTTSTGTYAIAGLAPGSYYVAFSDPTGTYASGLYSSSGFTIDKEAASPVNITSADVTGIDIQLPLARHVSGTVIGPDGQPLVGIQATASPAAVWGVSEYGLTDGAGAYTIGGLVAEPYIVSFYDPNGTYASGYYATSGITADKAAASIVDLTTGDESGIDIQLPLGYHIRGTVTGSDGGALAGIDVYACIAAGGICGWASTATDGSYTVGGLPAGSYRVNFNDWTGTYLDGYYSDTSPGNFTTLWEEATLVPVTDADVALATVTLPTGYHISGTVTGPGGAGLVVDISVCAWGSSGGDCTEARIAADGSYSVGGLPAGDYRVYFNDWTGTYPFGYYSETSPGNFTTNGSSATLVPVTDADVTLATVNLPTGYRISGRVTGPGGAGLTVDISVCASGETTGGDCTEARSATDGTYSLTVVPGSYRVSFDDWTGTYPFGYYSETSPGNFTTNGSSATLVPVTDADVALLEVNFPIRYDISGRVTGPGGAGLSVDVSVCAGSEVSVGDCTEARTGTDGTYNLTVVPGAYRVSFNDWTGGTYPDGYYSETSAGNFTTDWSIATLVSVTEADVALETVTLPAGYHISGKVTGPDGTTPVAGIHVWACPDVGSCRGVETGDDGAYLSQALGPGVHRVSFYDPTETYPSGHYAAGSPGNFTTLWSEATLVSVTDADVPNINVSLPDAAHISGTVKKPDGTTPAANISVSACTSLGGCAWGQTDASGTYRLAVVPGSYRVSFSDWTGTYPSGFYAAGSPGNFTTSWSSATPVEVDAGDVATADVVLLGVTLPTGYRISGTVFQPDGTTPAANIWVNACADVGGCGWGQTAADGSYTTTALGPGSYRVSYDDPSGTYPSGIYREGSPGNFTTDWSNATLVDVASADVALLDVTLPVGYHISGTVSQPDGTTPAANISVTACSDASGGGCTSRQTDSSGMYSLTVIPGSYRVIFDDWTGTYPDGYYAAGSPGNFTTFSSNVTLVDVASADVALLDVTLPVGYHISGTVFQPDGTTPAANIWVTACPDASGGGCTRRQTDSNGMYSLTVIPGSYRVGFEDWTGPYPDGFYIDDPTTGNFTAEWSLATSVVVTTGDVDNINIQYPDTTPPSGTVSINGGAASTTSVNVSVAVPATDAGSGLAKVRLSSNADMSEGVTQDYATPVSWTLTSGLGTKTVYVRWQDAVGNWSEIASDSIELVPPPPPPPPAGGVAGAVAITGVDGVYTIAVAAGTIVELVDPLGPGTSIKVTFTSAATGTIVVKPLGSLPSGVGAPPADNVVALFSVELTGGVTDAAISNVVFLFTAPWVVPNVALQRYANGTWITLLAAWIGVSDGVATYEAQSSGLSIYAVTGARVVAGTAASAPGVTSTGPFSRVTKVLAARKYVTIKFSLGAAYAGKKVGIWTAGKSSSGAWSKFTRTTTRIADAKGDVYYSVRSLSSAWKSFRAMFDGEGPLVPKPTYAVQARWR